MAALLAVVSGVAFRQLPGRGPESKGLPGSHEPAARHSSPDTGTEVSGLIRTKPVEALRLAAQLEDIPTRNGLFCRAIAEWSTRDGNAALRWIAKLDDPVLRDELRSIALVHFASYDPAAAAEALVSLLPQGDARDLALGPLYQRWAQRDPGAARASARALADPAERNRALEQIVRQVAADDPSGAIRLLVEEDLTDSSPDLLEELAARWAVLDHKASREWIDLLAEGEVRDRLLKQAAAVLARKEPHEAAEWVLKSIPAGMIQDEAILAVLGEWLLSDVDAAGRWAAGFPPGPLRSRAEDEVRRAMLR